MAGTRHPSRGALLVGTRHSIARKKEEVIPKIRYYKRAPLNTLPRYVPRSDLDPDLTELNSEDAGLPAQFSGSTKPFREVAATGRRRRLGGPLHPGTTMNTLYPTVNQFYDQPKNNAHPMEAGQKQGRVSPMAQFRELCRTLNRQYNLKLLFHLWVAVILVVILYVVLI